MASKTSRTTNFSEQEKLLLAKLGRDFQLDLTPKILMVSNATLVSFKDAGGGWNFNRKRSMTYNVVKQEKLVEEKLLLPQVK